MHTGHTYKVVEEGYTADKPHHCPGCVIWGSKQGSFLLLLLLLLLRLLLLLLRPFPVIEDGVRYGACAGC
jgi:hypothetical protein